jgi:glycosyltransferase involved in cell wall biosynthesis
VHWIREERLLISNSNYTKTHVEANKRKEIEAYKAGDIILAVTEQDKRHILKELPLKQVEIVSNIHRQEVNEYNDSGSNKILFFGGFKHTPNIEAVHYLVKEIFPEVLEKVPNAELIIAGSNAPREIIHLGTLPGVTFKGFIPEGELKILYDSIFISVVPLKAGSGIKGKVCESIAYRKPVITNQIGNEGIGLVHEKDALICENSEMANYIIKSMNRAFNFDDMTNNAWRKIENLIDNNKVRERLLAILEIY